MIDPPILGHLAREQRMQMSRDVYVRFQGKKAKIIGLCVRHLAHLHFIFAVKLGEKRTGIDNDFTLNSIHYISALSEQETMNEPILF